MGLSGRGPGQDPSRPNAGDRRHVAPPQPVAVDAATTVVPRPDRRSFDISRKNADGSQVVISQKTLPDGSQRLSGFRQTEDARTGTVNRIYSDGARVVQGRDFERRTLGSGATFVTKRDGLREAVAPDGRPVFQDRFTAVRESDGRTHQMIERTRYARWVQGKPQFEPTPVVRRYEVAQFHGQPTSYYRPARLPPEHYHGIRARYAVPVALAAVGTYVAFQSMSSSSAAPTYSDPVALMGDMQIASGFEEGYAYAAPPSGATGVYDTPEAAALRSQMSSVQGEVSSNLKGNQALQGQLGGLNMQATSSQVQQSVGSAVPVQVSEEVREQIRKQVRLSVALQQNGKPLALGDVLSSGYARIYLFQTAQPLNVAGVSAPGECFLNTGDLIGFSRLPEATAQVAEMRVVASTPNSCQPGDVVQVKLTDLQEMLNGFTERVEENLKRVTACAAAGKC